MQWLFNIIFEWVEAKMYATQAWVEANFYTQAQVEEWVEPVHVAGTLGPDVTCTYHKAGTYNGKPYYVRNDGVWFIWWYSTTSTWILSPGTGVIMGPQWRRSDPDIEGDYAASGGAIGVATVTAGYGCLKLCFVDRGDPANYDFLETDLIEDGTWRDLNLGSIVPAGAKAVLLRVYLRHAAINRDFRFRKKGNAQERNIFFVRTIVANLYIMEDAIVACDANRVIQYYATAPSWADIRITVGGWWL